MARPNRHQPDIFKRIEQSNEARGANAERASGEMISVEELSGSMNRSIHQDFHISRPLLEGLDMDALERQLAADMMRRMDEVIVRGNGRPFLSNGDPFMYHGGLRTGRQTESAPARQELPRINMDAARKSVDKLRDAFSGLGKMKVVLDKDLSPNAVTWKMGVDFAEPEPVQVGETHTSPESTEGFALPWVQGPQPERIGKDGKPVGKQRSDNSYVLQEGKRIYAYVENEHGQRVRQFIAQTNGPRVAQYIIDACNAYANEANTMGQNSAVIAANLRRELQETKLVNSQNRVQLGRELTQYRERMQAQTRVHEAQIKDMQREIDKANAAKLAAEKQCADARQALADRKQKTLEEFKPTEALAGRRIRFRKENSDELE